MKNIKTYNAKVISMVKGRDECVVSFGTYGQVFECSVDVSAFNRLKIGQRGTLKLDGKRFISFT